MKKQKRTWRATIRRLFRDVYDVLTAPAALVLLTYSHDVHPAYGLSWPARVWLGVRLWYTHGRVITGTSWRAHLVMAMKLLEIPPEKKGVVVECGCWKGGTTSALSIICDVVGRELYVYDSYEGLPEPKAGDRIAQRTFGDQFLPGIFGGTLEEVQENVRRCGVFGVCHFVKGWFEDTLPHHEGDIVFAYIDVDFCASLHDCMVNLWPHIVDGGFVFLDEYRQSEIYSLFFSEKFWNRYFSCNPPGLVGTGSGVQVGMHYNDPSVGMRSRALQYAQSTAYCVKGVECIWDYEPEGA